MSFADTNARVLMTAALASVLVCGCGDEIAISGQTVGEARMIRPSVTVQMQDRDIQLFEDLRLLPGSRVKVDGHGRAVVVLDHGAQAIVDASTSVEIEGMEELRFSQGRIWVDAGEKESTTVLLGKGKEGTLKVSGCSVSLKYAKGQLDAYVASGELTYILPGGSGTVREGERLAMSDGSEPEVSPSGLWEDWTGGLALAGPRPLETPTGVGAIYARRPGSLGQERSPLVIRRQEVRVTIEGDLAVTETVQEFFNPASEVLEGIYKLRIPEDAVLQRFAVDRDGTLVDGEVVERTMAQQTYEKQVYTGSPHDPALLEWMAPGRFKARIYPIEAGAIRRIAYRYSQWLKPSGREGDRRTYVFPMGNQTIAPVIGEFSLSATLSDTGSNAVRAGLGAHVDDGKVVFSASDFRPTSDFTLELLDVETEDLEPGQVLLATTDYEAPEPLPTSSARKLRLRAEKETYFFTQFALRPEELNVAPVRDLRMAVVLDLSAATDTELADLGTMVVDDLLRQLGPDDHLVVLAGDLKVDVVGGESASLATEDFKEAAIEALSRRSTGGATDIGEILTGAASLVGDEPGGVVVYVGDAFPTVGEMDLESLQARIARLPHAVRTYGVALGEESNLDLLDGLCRDGGFSSRVSDRTEAAEMAYRILADASVPVLENVTYSIDGGVERLYPRGARTLRITQPMRILGRLTGEKDPQRITVQGTNGGRTFEVTLEPVIEKIDDHGDLRKRWAARRLDSLIQEGAGREAVVELGNRFSLVTPYNSILVPSGTSESPSKKKVAMPVSSAPAPAEATIDSEMDQMAKPALRAKDLPDGSPSLEATGTMSAKASVTVGVPTVQGPMKKTVIRRVVRQNQQALATCYSLNASAPDLSGTVTVKFVITSSGAVKMASVSSSTLNDSAVESCMTKAIRKMKFPATSEAGIVIVTIPIALKSSGAPWGGGLLAAMPPPGTTTTSTTSLTLTHSTTTSSSSSVDTGGPGGLSANKKACLLSSLLPLEEKIVLWQERLGNSTSASRAMQVWREARNRCELRTMKERRALARVILSRVRGISGRCSLVKSLSGQPAVAAYIRSKILSSLTSPGQIDAVMTHCDGAVTVGPEELETVLAKAKNADARIQAVKGLIALYPMDLDLKLKLLDLLEDEGGEERLAEAMRLASRMRHAPYANERIRTRIGEFYMRNGYEDEARRTFSEIVEFSPFSPAARRLLGDLYLNYGWAEDAYRQYETLMAMVPEDDSVLILLAEAAADAGRTDEALRLASRVSQSSAGSGSTTEVARLFNTLRLASLRVKARQAGDQRMLDELLKRSRRAGVLRDSVDLRVVLVWQHPDVELKLFARYAGSEMERASTVAPHFGCEALWEKESSGELIVQVVRDEDSVVKETAATLYFLWYEGTDREQLEIIELRLDEKPRKKEKAQKAWKLSPPPGTAEQTEPVKMELFTL